MNNSKTLVAILNWNGWEDTVACCKSLLAAEMSGTDVLIFDNGSSNDSAAALRNQFLEWGSQKTSETIEVRASTLHVEVFDCTGITFKLHSHPDNLGFAKGCNYSASYAEVAGYDYLILLNNDTTIKPDAFVRMRETLDAQCADIVIPQIRYFDEPDRFWNCGGEVSYWGQVRYYHARALAKDTRLPPTFPVGFATGCCMLCRVNFFVGAGGFTEDFFFGEEDVELSLRLKKQSRSLICDTRAVVFHKVGASLKGNPEFLSRKAYVHLLNRLINMRSFMPWLIWNCWSFIVCSRVYLSNSYSFPRSLSYVIKLFIESRTARKVGKERFREIIDLGV